MNYKTIRDTAYTAIAVIGMNIMTNYAYAGVGDAAAKGAVSATKKIGETAQDPNKIKEITSGIIGGVTGGVIGGLEGGEKEIEESKMFKRGKELFGKISTAEGRNQIWLAGQYSEFNNGKTETNRLKRELDELLGIKPKPVAYVQKPVQKPKATTVAQVKKKKLSGGIAELVNTAKEK